MSKKFNKIETRNLEFNGQKINYTLSGNSGPSIVFLNGHRTPLTSWSKVIPRISKVGTVLAYDRLDTGGSGKSSNPQDGDAIISTLNSLFKAIDLSPPYILVAHSLGGLYANLYARRYPGKTGAVVFVEAGHPSEAEEYSQQQISGSGLFGKLLSVFTPGFRKDRNSEFNNVDATVSQIENAPEFPNKIVAVITGGTKMPFVPEDAFNKHLNWQKKLVALSSSGYQVIAEKSGHAPQLSEPDLVVQVITHTAQTQSDHEFNTETSPGT